MSLPFLIYCSLLRRAQYKSLQDLNTVQNGTVDMTAIEQAIRAVVTKRLMLSREFLSFSEGLLQSGEGGEIMERNVVSRAYYSAHHAVRALLLFDERGDVDGHREAIEATYDLLKRNPAVRTLLGAGNAEQFRKDFGRLLERRHLADYYPYGTNASSEAPLDFSLAAREAIQFARRIIEKTEEYITLKEAGRI